MMVTVIEILLGLVEFFTYLLGSQLLRAGAFLLVVTHVAAFIVGRSERSS